MYLHALKASELPEPTSQASVTWPFRARYSYDQRQGSTARKYNFEVF